MKLTDQIKEKNDNAKSEEVKKITKETKAEAGRTLNDDELDEASGGQSVRWGYF